jgi:hypothetical protein
MEALMTPEEEFNETESVSAIRQELIRHMNKDKWVGLTDKEIYQVDFDNKSFYESARMIEQMLKWRNT